MVVDKVERRGVTVSRPRMFSHFLVTPHKFEKKKPLHFPIFFSFSWREATRRQKKKEFLSPLSFSATIVFFSLSWSPLPRLPAVRIIWV